MSPFMSQKTVSMTFFTDHYTWNFFFTGKSVCFHSMDCLFDSDSLRQTHILPISKLKRASLYTSHSIDFIWFAFLSHQKLDDRPLFKPGAL